MPEMDSHAIGQTLIKLRGTRTQEEVAKEIGISKSALSMYERGERIPRVILRYGYPRIIRSLFIKFFFDQKTHET